MRVQTHVFRIAVTAAVVAAAGMASITSAHAATFTVTRFDDPAPGACDPADCSLREAIVAANASPGADTVSIQEGTYNLTIPSPGEVPFATDATQGDLDVTDPLTLTVAFTGLDGPMRPGAGATIDAGGRFSVGSGISVTQRGIDDRVLHVTSSFSTGFVTLTGGTSEQGAGVLVDGGSLSMHMGGASGNASTGTCCGGGISAVQSTVNLNGATVSNNAVAGCCGGGIYNESSAVTIAGGAVSDNDAFGCCGGGVYNRTDPAAAHTATLSLSATTVSGNDVRDCCGGAIYSKPQATVTADTTTFRSNTAGTCCGGAIYNEGTFSLDRGSISNNSIVNCCGGGLAALGTGSSTTLTNVTVSSNNAGSEPGQPTLPSAGGIYLDPGGGHVSLTHVTVAANNGSNGASGIASGDVGSSPAGAVTMLRSIVSGNQGAPQCLGPVSSQGYNIASDGSCTLTHATDRPSTDPQLAPSNGSFHALGAGSPAMDAIPTNVCPPPPRDQVGIPRPQDRAEAPGAGCDIGAIEMAGTAATPPPIDPRCDDAGVVCGTDGSETIVGTGDGELIICGDGDDVVEALGGDDTIECGGPGDTGDKEIDAGSGDDEVYCGGTGDDDVRAGAGNDDVDCGAGTDELRGGKGRDRVVSTNGNDMIYGGAGRDLLSGGAGADGLFGGNRRDVLSGGRGRDSLLGQRGRDSFFGGPGRDGCDARRSEETRGCETRIRKRVVR